MLLAQIQLLAPTVRLERILQQQVLLHVQRVQLVAARETLDQYLAQHVLQEHTKHLLAKLHVYNVQREPKIVPQGQRLLHNVQHVLLARTVQHQAQPHAHPV
jgi:hypothetical protein